MKELIDALKKKDTKTALFALNFLTDEEVKAIKDEKGSSIFKIAFDNDLNDVVDALITRGIIETIETREPRERKEAKEVRELREPRAQREALEPKEPKEARERKEVKEAREPKERKERTETKQAKDLPRDLPTEENPLEVLQFINETLAKSGSPIKMEDCACCPQFTRTEKTLSVRDELDNRIPKWIKERFPLDQYPTIRIVDFGPGKMKQLATTVGNLMKAGYNVEIIMIDHDFRAFSAAALRETLPTAAVLRAKTAAEAPFQQFQTVLSALESRYKQNAKIVGYFSSLENYKAALAQIGPHQVKVRTHLDKKSGKQVPNEWEITRDMKSQNIAFNEEYEKFANACRGKIPQLVTLIDDKLVMGHAYGSLELSHMYSTGAVSYKDMELTVSHLYNDLVTDVCHFADPKQKLSQDLPPTKQNEIVFVSTLKTPASDMLFVPRGTDKGLNVQVEALGVSISDPTKRQVIYDQRFAPPPAAPERERPKPF